MFVRHSSLVGKRLTGVPEQRLSRRQQQQQRQALATRSMLSISDWGSAPTSSSRLQMTRFLSVHSRAPAAGGGAPCRRSAGVRIRARDPGSTPAARRKLRPPMCSYHFYIEPDILQGRLVALEVDLNAKNRNECLPN